MKSKLKYFKRSTLILKVLLLGYSVSGQIYTWGDISTANANYSVISIVEGKANQLYVLGKVTDKNFKKSQIGYSLLSATGEILNSTVFADMDNLYDINSMLFQPDGFLRVYGTAYQPGGMMAPFAGLINTSTNTITKNIFAVKETQYIGDVRPYNDRDFILTKAIKGTSNGIYNIDVSKFEMKAQDIRKRHIKLASTFNEEPKNVFVNPDTSLILLGRRYSDQTMSKSEGMIYFITPDFKMKWNMEVLNSSGLSNQALSCGKDGWIYYFCSFKDKNTGSISSKGFIFDKDGNKLRQIFIDSTNVNVIITLKNGNILAAGSKMQKYGSGIVEKAHYIIYDKTLKKISSRTLGKSDKPDVDMYTPNTSNIPGSSEFTTAFQLNIGKIVLGGKAQVPVNANPDKSISSPKAFKYLIAILKPNGDL
jgi:hypothetical protein